MGFFKELERHEGRKDGKQVKYFHWRIANIRNFRLEKDESASIDVDLH